MPRLLIHAGRHKSGTSALQRTLHDNREALIEASVYYPEIGVRGFGHHELSERLTPAGLRQRQSSQKAREIWMQIIEQAERFESETILLSSEAFQNCRPEVVADFFEGHHPEIVFYARNKVDCAVSAYGQKVLATDYHRNLDEFVQQDFKFNYVSYFEKWMRVFGDSLHIHKYLSPRDGFDIVASFFSTFLAGIDGVGLHKRKSNESLSLEFLILKRAMNEKGVADQLRFDWNRCLANPDLFHGVADTPVSITAGTLSHLRKTLKDEDLFLQSLPGFEGGFRYEYVETCPPDLDGLFSRIEKLMLSTQRAPESSSVWRRVFHRAIQLAEEDQTRNAGNRLGSKPLESNEKYTLFFNSDQLVTRALPTTLERVQVPGVDIPRNRAVKGPIDLSKGLVIEVNNSIAVLDDVWAILPEGVVLKDFSFLGASTWMSKLQRRNYIIRGQGLGADLLFKSDRLDLRFGQAFQNLPGSTLYAYNNSQSNYFHWHFEVLARIFEFLQHGSFDDVDHVFVGPVEQDWKWASLEVLGVPTSKIVIPSAQNLRMEKAIYPLLRATVDSPLLQALAPGGGTHFKGWNESFVGDFGGLVSAKLKVSVDCHPERLFVDRGDPSNRRIANSREVLDMFEKWDFTTVYPETMTYEVQVQSFAGAKIVAGIHGAGLTNCLWMPANGTILEFVPESYPDVNYRILAALKHARYYRMDCRVESATPPLRPAGLSYLSDKHSDLYVDIEQLEKFMYVLMGDD